MEAPSGISATISSTVEKSLFWRGMVNCNAVHPEAEMCAGAKCGGNSTHLPKDFNMGRARDRIGVVSDQVDRGNERPQRHQVNAFTSIYIKEVGSVSGYGPAPCALPAGVPNRRIFLEILSRNPIGPHMVSRSTAAFRMVSVMRQVHTVPAGKKASSPGPRRRSMPS